MWKMAKSLLGSKKFLAAILSGVAWGLLKVGVKLDVEELLPMVGPLWLYILGQGVADWGKEAAKATDPRRAPK